jgi:FAD/FMN-containing dehydrogenase/Fe-S oxidoreductase
MEMKAQAPSSAANDIDSRALAAELTRLIKGEVRFDDGSRALYATDASNYRQVPIGVVIPRDVDDVIATVATAQRHGAPILGRGAGTSLSGQCCNVAVILDFSKYMNRILELDPVRRLARVEPGCVLDSLRAAAERHHLTFGPDPATHNHCTLGGMIGNNSCGVHSVMAGKTDDNVLELDVLLYDGTRLRLGRHHSDSVEATIQAGGRRSELFAALLSFRDRYAEQIRARFPAIPRLVSGYSLPWLLPENGFDLAKAMVGSEGTLAIVLEATVRLVWSPPARSLLVLGYPDIFHAADHVPEVLEAGPIGLEAIDDRLVYDMRAMKIHPETLELLPQGRGWLLVEFGAESKREADDKARTLLERLKKAPYTPSMRLCESKEEENKIWTVRRSGLGATAHVPGKKLTWEGWEDAAVHPEKLGRYLRDFRKLLDQFGYEGDLYGHFGDGCVHTRIDFDLQSAPGLAKFRSFLDAAADLVVAYGGSLSGEHGDGQAKAAMLPKMYGEELVRAFEEFKTIWDPDWKMNPGKVVRAFDPTQNLRLSFGERRPLGVKTHFQFPEDEGDYGRVMLRCVGVGECRRPEGGTMCPSFRVTQDEMHSTRGRARLLFEMLEGSPLASGWKSEPVREALDLCLACKGCKSDCPVNVDMATYKAEFLSHYYDGRLRPRHAYSMGQIHRWARLAALAPRLVNFLGRNPVSGPIVKWLAGIARGRRLPLFARETFRDWFAKRETVNEGKPRVILWADTFNNYFHPQVARAAVEVLEAAGFQVTMPAKVLCCGRPLYDFGMLDKAKALLRDVLDALKPDLATGVPIVGLEPSCVAVFRDEMAGLLPDDEDAKRLREQTFLLSEFLNRHAQSFHVPGPRRKAMVHMHCHHKAVIKTKDEEDILRKLGLDLEVLDSGCCGMAGSFGFESSHYDISRSIGEMVLLPAVRRADADALIITDGFSCKEQIEQCTNRQTVHLAEVIRMALQEDKTGR